jgi:hypothetical protein
MRGKWYCVDIHRLTYRLRTACIETKRAGTLNVSKKISAAFSLFRLGLRGASVSSTGCCKKGTQLQANCNMATD